MLLKATLIYRRTGNLRAVQLLLGHTKIESTARYLGIDVDDAFAIAEQVDVPGRAEVLCPCPTYDVRYFDRLWGKADMPFCTAHVRL